MPKMTSWWRELSAKKRGYIFFAVVFLVLAIAAIASILGPIIPEDFCTLVDCLGSGVTLELENLPADSSYQVEVTNPAGESLALSCDGNDMQGSAAIQCSSEKVYISLEEDYAPEEFTVTITLNGEQLSEVFHPNYEISQPNGEGCPPTCYYATVVMKMP